MTKLTDLLQQNQNIGYDMNRCFLPRTRPGILILVPDTHSTILIRAYNAMHREGRYRVWTQICFNQGTFIRNNSVITQQISETNLFNLAWDSENGLIVNVP